MSKFIGFVTHEQADNLTGVVDRVAFDSHVGTKKEIKSWFSKMQSNEHLYMQDVNAKSFNLEIKKY